MADKYLIANVIGDGTEDNPYRADISPYGSCLIPSNLDGSPKFSWCLVKGKTEENYTGVGVKRLSATQEVRDNLNGKGVDVSKLPNLPEKASEKALANLVAKHLDRNYK